MITYCLFDCLWTNPNDVLLLALHLIVFCLFVHLDGYIFVYVLFFCVFMSLDFRYVSGNSSF